MKEVIEKYLGSTLSDQNHRYKSWEHCYNAFNNPHDSVNYLALQLAFYLASWGMYRGSSGLLWKDYKVHCGAVEIIKDHNNLRKEHLSGLPKQQDVLIVFKELSEYYSKIEYCNGKNVKNQITPTDTLISKIILGTLGCLPAFDRYFNLGVFRKEYSIINEKSLEKIWDITNERKTQIESVQKWIYMELKMWYPVMKIIDMYYWQEGFDFKPS